MDEDHLKGNNPHYIQNDVKETRKLFIDRQLGENHLKGDNLHYILSDAKDIRKYFLTGRWMKII